VHIERLLRAASHRFDYHRPDRDIRHETTVHYVDTDLVGACRIDGANLLGEMPEISPQDRGCNDNRPLRRDLDYGCPGAQSVPIKAAGDAYISITVPGMRIASFPTSAMKKSSTRLRLMF
jgi:hypothetical protein